MRIQTVVRAVLLLGSIAASGCDKAAERAGAEAPAVSSSAPSGPQPVAPNAVVLLVNESTSCNTIGPEGGSIAHASRAKLAVPPGALASPTSLCLSGVAPASAATLGGPAVGQGFRATPAGQTFRKPVELELPFEATALPAGARLDQIQIQMAPSGTADFVAVSSTVDLGARVVRAQTVHFTEFVPAVNPNPVFVTSPTVLPHATVGAPYSYGLESNGPYRTWAFEPGSSLAPPGLTLTSAGLLSGTLHQPATFAFFVVATDGSGRSVRSTHSITAEIAVAPSPSITSISPTHAEQGAPATTIAISGSGFIPSSSVRWDNAPIASTFVSPTELAAAVPAALLQSAGEHAITILNPAPGGASAPVTFTVDPAPQNPVPVVVSITPEIVTPSATDTQVTIIGEHFVSAASAAIGGQGISTAYLSPTKLIATIPAAHLTTPGTIPISVYNPGPGGGFSATSVTLTVGTINPVPVAETLAPAVATAGVDAVVVMTGTGFVAGGAMFLGSTALVTTFESDTRVAAFVPASLIVTPGEYDIRFVNPAPGGGTTVSIPISIAAPPDAGVIDAADADADADADAIADADAGTDGAPTGPPSTCGDGVAYYLSEPMQVTIWHEYDYLLHQEPCGSLQIYSCEGGSSGVSLGSSGIATSVLMPGWYRQVTTTCEWQPPFDSQPYYNPSAIAEPVAETYPPGCIAVPAGGITMRLDMPTRCFTFEVTSPGRVTAGFSMAEPMRGGATLSGPFVESGWDMTSCYRDANPFASGRTPCSLSVASGDAGTYTISVTADVGTKISVGGGAS